MNAIDLRLLIKLAALGTGALAVRDDCPSRHAHHLARRAS
jgi:hypothetical protein